MSDPFAHRLTEIEELKAQLARERVEHATEIERYVVKVSNLEREVAKLTRQLQDEEMRQTLYRPIQLHEAVA
jgi:predicted RNase H-like nuclease (RuvC/YqgF family)